MLNHITIPNRSTSKFLVIHSWFLIITLSYFGFISLNIFWVIDNNFSVFFGRDWNFL
jgi:hypothetical protein